MVIFGASYIYKPDPGGLLAFTVEAHAVRPDITAGSNLNAISARGQSFQTSLQHLRQMSPLTLPLLTVLFAGCYLVTVWLLKEGLSVRVSRGVAAITAINAVQPSPCLSPALIIVDGGH